MVPPVLWWLQTLTITGEGFSRVASENVIAIGPYACTNVAVTVNSPSDATAATQLTCQIGADVISGVRKVTTIVPQLCTLLLMVGWHFVHIHTVVGCHA